MTEDQLREFYNRFYEWLDGAIDYGLFPDEVANKAEYFIREIQGEE